MTHLATSTPSDKVLDLSVELADLNKLSPFSMAGPELIKWSQDIERLAPGATPEMIRFIMDCFKLEKIEWDRSKGIQNIFSALKMIKATNEGFTLMKTLY